MFKNIFDRFWPINPSIEAVCHSLEQCPDEYIALNENGMLANPMLLDEGDFQIVCIVGVFAVANLKVWVTANSELKIMTVFTGKDGYDLNWRERRALRFSVERWKTAYLMKVWAETTPARNKEWAL